MTRVSCLSQSEEDLELKARLEDCVERAQSRDPRLRIGAIDTLR